MTPVTGNGIYHGEDYDARIAREGQPGVEVLPFDHDLLVPHETEPVVEMPPVAAVDIGPTAAATVYDFGQNCGAYARITVKGPAGAHVRVSIPRCWGRTAALTTATIARPGPNSTTRWGQRR